jgi:hypothetical protein
MKINSIFENIGIRMVFFMRRIDFEMKETKRKIEGLIMLKIFNGLAEKLKFHLKLHNE